VEAAAHGWLAEAGLILLLILVNGFFAGAEIALVSASRVRLQALAEDGDARARAALRLKADPDRLLATVQVGITLVGTLASAVGGVTAAERLEPVLRSLSLPDWLAPFAQPIAVALVVLAIAYLSLVVGELTPKSLAVRRAEGLSLRVAPIILWLSRLARPAVSGLTASTGLLLRLIGVRGGAGRPFHTLDDLRAIVAAAEASGVLHGELMSGAVSFHEREVREVMTPRTRIDALQVDESLEQALRKAVESGHSRYPVYTETLDDVVGFVYARDLYETARRRVDTPLARLVRPAMLVPWNRPATEMLTEMRRERQYLALAVDEHGSTRGLVTLEDLLEVIVGEIRDEDEKAVEPVRRLPDGSLEVDASVPIKELNQDFGLRLPEGDDYVTLAGLVLTRLGTIPRGGEVVDSPPYRLEVVRVQRHRIALVRLGEQR
jgi:putative hemolysin